MLLKINTFETNINIVRKILIYKDKLISCSDHNTIKIWDKENVCLATLQNVFDNITLKFS